jgi:hypothetical protein
MKPSVGFEAKLGETVATSFEAKLEKTIVVQTGENHPIGFEAKLLINRRPWF